MRCSSVPAPLHSLRRGRVPGWRRALLHGALALMLGGCGLSETVLAPLRGTTPHERYMESLERSGLGESVMARQWARMSQAAFLYPVEPSLPFREEGRFAPAEPTSLAYRFELRRGERLQVVLERVPDGEDAGEPENRVFMDLFRLRDPERRDSPDGRPLAVAWTEPSADTLVYEARASAVYVLRVQPELLAGGAFALEVGRGGSLEFPVAGHDTGHIQSGFGAARDGGRRVHHGVDVFAPRGTPVLAAGAGVVTRVRETPVGGRVVWVRDEARGLSRYYAHLDSQLVEAGDSVLPGDTLGTVGNTGNARTTPPHLHFGIYVQGEGPVDPWPFLHRPPAVSPALTVDRSWFLGEARFRTANSSLRTGPGGPPLGVDGDPGPVRIVAGSGSWYRVRLGDGREAYAAPASLDPLPPAHLPSVGVAGRLPASEDAH